MPRGINDIDPEILERHALRQLIENLVEELQRINLCPPKYSKNKRCCERCIEGSTICHDCWVNWAIDGGD